VRKSAPIVALYWLLNFLFTYLNYITAQRKHNTTQTNQPTRRIKNSTKRNQVRLSRIDLNRRILVHQRRLPNPRSQEAEVSERQRQSPRRGEGDPKRSPAVAEDDDLEQGAAARGHRDLGPTRGGDLARGNRKRKGEPDMGETWPDLMGLGGTVANRDAMRCVFVVGAGRTHGKTQRTERLVR
jgi:hypothetical protein